MYKRQYQTHLIYIGGDDFTRTAVKGILKQINLFKTYAHDAACTAVSYTHLDVYKRQPRDYPETPHGLWHFPRNYV